ncbi:MAG: hypothetical protein PHP01_02270 [Phycisphaerae bacterium]|nr:hypothetical protein [Phycisphaerae bacterium]
MFKKFCIVLLFTFLLCGCQLANFAGGGGMYYQPPEKIICEKSWEIKLAFYVWPTDPKEKYGKLSERWKDVIIHIRDSSAGDFSTVPMVLQNVDTNIGKLYFKANMKPIPCSFGIKYVEYYIDEMFDGHYNRTELYRVPVSKN